jgi:hypothetical protein
MYMKGSNYNFKVDNILNSVSFEFDKLDLSIFLKLYLL